MSGQPSAPSWTEIAAMVAALGKPTVVAPAAAPAEDKTISKIGIGVATALIAALGVWIGSAMMTLTTTVSAIAPKIEALQTQLTQLNQGYGAVNQQVALQGTGIAKQDVRVTALEQNQARLMDRVRTLEGGPRIAAPAPGTNAP